MKAAIAMAIFIITIMFIITVIFTIKIVKFEDEIVDLNNKIYMLHNDIEQVRDQRLSADEFLDKMEQKILEIKANDEN